VRQSGSLMDPTSGQTSTFAAANVELGPQHVELANNIALKHPSQMSASSTTTRHRHPTHLLRRKNRRRLAGLMPRASASSNHTN
jgi:hypothetical protein